MTAIHIGRGSLIVENPPRRLMESLRRFRRNDSGEGEYEDLFTMSENGKNLVTMPGFANRAIRLAERDWTRIYDERVPMPKADCAAAMEGLHECWSGVVHSALKAEGGVISIPDVFGNVNMVAAILRAYPREALVDRGTPLSIISFRDRDYAKRAMRTLRKMLPGRDIGLFVSGTYTDSDDIIVTTYASLKEAPCWQAGVFVACDLASGDFRERAEGVSSLRNAARWGIYRTSLGGTMDVDIVTEGLFGPSCASASYADAVSGGFATPVVVCWLRAPKIELGSLPRDVLLATAVQDEGFCRMASDIIRRTPSELGCICCADNKALGERLAGMSGDDVVFVHRRTPAKVREAVVRDIASGTIRRAVCSELDMPQSDHGVEVIATCRGDAARLRIPGRPSKGPTDRSYVVTFCHDWDMHNGRPGHLARNDEVRKRRFQELGIRQMFFESVDQLPFLDS
jgi:hypothetical protein